jgi:pSer/pThr/pTyr-binding forkhead associated (FHA) protein
MLVELVASTKAENGLPCELPALVREDIPADAHAEPIEGKYNCLISRVDGQLVVWDLGSGGGTFVNGTRVTKACLKSGDRLRLGGAEFSVASESAARRYLFGVRC